MRKIILPLTVFLIVIFLSFASTKKVYAAPSSSCGANNIPASVAAGQVFSVNITMNNTGDTWTAATNFKAAFMTPRVDSQPGNSIWGPSRIVLPGGTTVTNGQSYTFTTTLTAPSTPGLYDNQWAMVQEGVTYFGSFCGPTGVVVSGPPVVNSVSFSPVSPYNSGYSNANSIDITANVQSPQKALTSVAISVNSDTNGGTGGSWIVLPSPCPGGTTAAYNCTQTWTPTTEGTHVIRVVANNGVNPAVTDTSRTIRIDKTPPVFTSFTTSVPSGTYLSQIGLTNLLADNGVGATGIRYIIIYANTGNGAIPACGTSPNWVPIYSCTASPGSSITSCNTTWQATGLTPGTTHTLTIDAKDWADNTVAGICPTKAGSLDFQIGAPAACT